MIIQKKAWIERCLSSVLVSLIAFSLTASVAAEDQNQKDSRLELIEGDNKVIFAETAEEKKLLIPKTTWRERERAVPPETCVLTMVNCSEGLNETAEAFLAEEEEDLRLAPGESFLVELNGAHWLTDVMLELDGESKAVLTVTDVNQTKRYDTYTFTQTKRQKIELEKLCTYLQIKCPEDEVNPLILRSLTIEGVPTLYEQVRRENPEDPVIIDAKDIKNPLHIYRIPLRQSVYRLAECLLEDTGDLSPHQKMMVFMDYISDWYVGLDNGRHYLALNAYIESCGWYSNLLAALIATQGYEARIVNLSNYPLAGGHTVCEVCYYECWHVYDPTYGAYYTTTPQDVISPNVLGFQELSDGRGNNPDSTCVVITPWRLTGPASYGFLGPQIYELANPKGPIGPEYPMIYPLNLDLSEGKVGKQNFDTNHQGISYIGAANINSSHLWTLSSLKAGELCEFIITASWLGGEVADPFAAKAELLQADGVREVFTHNFDGNDPTTMSWKICFTPESDSAKILLTHDFRGPELRYVSFSSFELIQGSRENE